MYFRSYIYIYIYIYISTHHDLLKTANTEHIHVKRIKETAREVFKIVNNIAPSFILNLIILKGSQYSMRKENTAVDPKANTSKYELKSFVHDGPRIWNSLPNEMYYYIYVLLITLFYMYYCYHFKYSVCLLWFYVSLLYTRLSENSSDERMLSNYHVNRR